MIKTIFWIWPHHHVGLVGDHPEAQLVELLHQLQQLVILPEVGSFHSKAKDSPQSLYLGFSFSCTCNSKAIWLTFFSAPDFIQSVKPPSLNSPPSMSI